MIFLYLKIDSKLSVYQNSKILAVKKILDLSPSEARMICGKFIKKKNVTKSPIYTSLDIVGLWPVQSGSSGCEVQQHPGKLCDILIVLKDPWSALDK